MKRLVRSILEWLIWSCVNGRNEYTSAVEIDITVITHLSQKLKSWQKLRLERTIGKWPEAHRLASPQINAGLAVAKAASLSVSQAKRFLCKVQTLQ